MGPIERGRKYGDAPDDLLEAGRDDACSVLRAIDLRFYRLEGLGHSCDGHAGMWRDWRRSQRAVVQLAIPVLGTTAEYFQQGSRGLWLK